jgi:hypothetical protein
VEDVNKCIGELSEPIERAGNVSQCTQDVCENSKDIGQLTGGVCEQIEEDMGEEIEDVSEQRDNIVFTPFSSPPLFS